MRARAAGFGRRPGRRAVLVVVVAAVWAGLVCGGEAVAGAPTDGPTVGQRIVVEVPPHTEPPTTLEPTTPTTLGPTTPTTATSATGATGTGAAVATGTASAASLPVTGAGGLLRPLALVGTVLVVVGWVLVGVARRERRVALDPSPASDTAAVRRGTGDMTRTSPPRCPSYT